VDEKGITAENAERTEEVRHSSLEKSCRLKRLVSGHAFRHAVKSK
jgi:hypothetical protein